MADGAVGIGPGGTIMLRTEENGAKRGVNIQ